MIELVRQPERLSFTVFVCGEVLKFARLSGWKPARTLPPECGGAQDDFSRSGGGPHPPRAGGGTDLTYRGPERREESGGGGVDRVLPPRRLRDLVSRCAASQPVSRPACAQKWTLDNMSDLTYSLQA